MLRLILFVLPLGLDTFAVTAALGIRGLPKRRRLRVRVLMSAFEIAMPILGLLLGRALGEFVGGAAEDVAIGVLALLGIWLLFHEDEAESGKAAQLMSGHGLALIALEVSISRVGLAIGFTIGLLHLSLWLAVLLIGAQAFTFAPLGLRMGGRLNATLPKRAEQLAGLALLGLATLIDVERFV